MVSSNGPIYTGTSYVMRPLHHAGSIEGAAHLVPLLPDEEKNKRWIVNTHIDLETWNNVYEFVGESQCCFNFLSFLLLGCCTAFLVVTLYY
jgi:hypothetical protein